MKLGLVGSLFLIACTGPSLQTESKPISDAAITSTDVGVDVTVIEIDAGSDVQLPITYVNCVTSSWKQTIYPRLTAKYCTDSLGNTFIEYYQDSLLGIQCLWNKSPTDLVVRCLPNAYQSASMYVDDTCSTPMIGIFPENTASLPKYAGIGFSHDGGAWGGIYDVGDAYAPPPPNYIIYLLEKNTNGQWQCDPLQFALINTEFLLLGDSVNPSIFQAQ
jgi:hypothetical protein